MYKKIPNGIVSVLVFCSAFVHAQEANKEALVSTIRDARDNGEVSVFMDLSEMASKFDVVLKQIHSFIERTAGTPLLKAITDTQDCIYKFFGVMSSIRNGLIRPLFDSEPKTSVLFKTSDGINYRKNNKRTFEQIQIKDLDAQVSIIKKAAATMNSSWKKVKPGFFNKKPTDAQVVLSELVDAANYLVNNFLNKDYNYKELRSLILSK